MKAQQSETILSLHVMLDEVIRAHGLMADSQSILAMQRLLLAKRMGKTLIATLLSNCLKAETEQADDSSLARLKEQIRFAQQALCPACRREVGKRWKESNNV